MRVLSGAILLSLFTFSFFIVLLACRNPRPSKWVSDALIGNLYCPLLVSFGLVGITLFVSGFYNFSAYGTTRLEVLIAAAILSVTAIGIKALKVKTRIAGYEKMVEEAAAEKARGASAVSQDNGRLSDPPAAALQASGSHKPSIRSAV